MWWMMEEEEKVEEVVDEWVIFISLSLYRTGTPKSSMDKYGCHTDVQCGENDPAVLQSANNFYSEHKTNKFYGLRSTSTSTGER